MKATIIQVMDQYLIFINEFLILSQDTSGVCYVSLLHNLQPAE